MENRRIGGPSGLPVPSYASETPQRQSRLGRMRQSLGGSHAQASNPFLQADRSINAGLQPNPLTQSALRMPSSSVRRQSTRPGGPGNPQLAGLQTPALAMRTPMRQPAMMSMPGSVAPKATIPRTQYLPDDRPLRERAHQSIMLKVINDFLRENGKDTVLRSHPTPSAKEFQETFLFIYNITFEDDHVPGAKKMDEEVVELLRAVRYPWIDGLAKLQFSIITPHVWPQLLGSLYWMVAGYDIFTSWLDEGKDQNLVEDNMDDPSQNGPFDNAALLRLFLSYLGDVWLDYCSHKDNFPEQRANFMAIFDENMAAETDALEESLQTLSKLKIEAEILKNAKDLEQQLKDEIAELDAKLDNYQETKRALLNKTKQQDDYSGMLDQDIKAAEERLAVLISACARLHEDVKRQNISPEEVARMYRDREALAKQLDDLSTKDIELQKRADELSVSIFRAADDVDAVVEEISKVLWDVKLRPKPPPPFKPGEFDINFNRGTDDLESMLSGADVSINGSMIRNLMKYTDMLRAEKAELASQAVKLDNELDVAVTDLQQIRVQVDDTSKAVREIMDQLILTKKAWEDESGASKLHLETMRREMTKIKMSNQDRGLELSMRLDTLRLQKNETSLKLQRIATRLRRDLLMKAEELTTLKTWTTEQLQSLTNSALEDDLELLGQIPEDLDVLVQRLSLIK